MTTFYLVRHGEKQSEDIMVGRMPGIHLTATGRRQARLLGSFLRPAPITRIFSSPLERAVETAQPLAEMRDLKVESMLAFHELDMGTWTGKPKATVQASKAWKRFCRFHGGTVMPGGETLAEAQARVVSQMIRLRLEVPDGSVAIATHEDPIRLALCYFIGAPIGVYVNIRIRPGSVTILRVNDEHAIIDRLDVVPPGRRARLMLRE